MKNFLKQFGILVIILIILAAAFSYFRTDVEEPTVVGIPTLIQYIDEDRVTSLAVDGTKISITLTDGIVEEAIKEPGESFGDIIANYQISAEKIQALDISIKDETSNFFITALLPFLIPFIFIGAFIFFMMRQVQGANSKAMTFGQSTAKETNPDTKEKVSFKDVAGAREAKEELMEVVDFLKNPEKFVALGAKIPKGVLLLGPPGTGKTLLSRAVAGEANVPFLHISGSEFVEMFVGVGASRVRDLFKKAKKLSPCIIFIDEIDAVGRQRGSGLGGSHDEREQTLNQILVEMDGFDVNTNVIVIAATNRPDVLDPALLRPGRFDRRVMLDSPDLIEREMILKVHAKGKPLSPDASLKKVAQRTPGFSGADLANLLNEAAILTARHNKKIVSEDYILESIDKVLLGPARKSKIFSEKEKNIIAHHEAGHAVVAHMLPNADPVHKVSIISRGRAGGYTLKLPIEDRNLHNYKGFVDELAVMMGGMAIEKLQFGDLTTGPGSDIQQATSLAKKIITQYGMSKKLAPRTYGEKDEMIFLGKEITEKTDYSEKTAEAIDSEVSQLISNALNTATKILKENKKKVADVVEALLEKETLEKDDFGAIMNRK